MSWVEDGAHRGLKLYLDEGPHNGPRLASERGKDKQRVFAIARE
jgi:hypothetical protein